MKILAFDTTGKTATAALTDDIELIGITTLNTENTHSVTLLPMINDLLSRSGTDITDVGLVVCSAGPGSFTGVRIGAATAKGLAYPHGIPCIGVSSLEALAMNACAENGIVSSVMDARRGQLYNALFRLDGGEMTRLTEDRTVTAAELAKELSATPLAVYLTGDGCSIAEKAIEGLSGEKAPDIRTLPGDRMYQNAYNVAVLGWKTYSAMTDEEKALCTAEKLSPVYLRASSAERERLEREAKTGKDA